MSQRIVYKTADGGVAVIIPSKEAIDQWGIKAIADKDVPAGRPYKIVNVSDIPADRTFRAAWDVDVATLTDGVGADSDAFTEVPA